MTVAWLKQQMSKLVFRNQGITGRPKRSDRGSHCRTKLPEDQNALVDLYILFLSVSESGSFSYSRKWTIPSTTDLTEDKIKYEDTSVLFKPRIKLQMRKEDLNGQFKRVHRRLVNYCGRFLGIERILEMPLQVSLVFEQRTSKEKISCYDSSLCPKTRGSRR